MSTKGQSGKMVSTTKKRGRRQAARQIRLEVVRRPESEIDKRQLALALIELAKSLQNEEVQPPKQLN